MKRLLILSAASLMATTAFAADAIVYQPVEEVVVIADTFSWTGGYIGAHAGYGWGKTQDVYNSKESPEKKMKGGFGGLQAGYNWQFDNNVVLGAEADVSFGNIKKNWTESVDGDTPSSTYYTQDKIGTHGTVRARLGYAVDRFLPYVTGGLAWADTKNTLGCTDKGTAAGSDTCRSSAGANRVFEDSASKTRVGYSVGAGVEYAVTNNWTVKGEYLYSDFGKKNVTLTDPNWPGSDGTRRFKTKLNEVRIGVNYKF